MGRPVLVLHTGGTIGMEPSPQGLRPMAGFGDVLRERLGPQARQGLPEWTLVELDELIDSANLQPAHWQRIAEALVARWDDHAGFVVLHGTDTMAWTASALSSMLRGADKPVVLTGAQIPLQAPRSDALVNFETALSFAADRRIREVAVCFDRWLLRGNRSTKLGTVGFDAFASPNYPPLAEVGIDITVHPERLLPERPRDFFVPRFDSGAVAVLNVHPGLSPHVLDAVTGSPGLRGLVLRSYGAGNVPASDGHLMRALAGAVARGVAVVNTSQCVRGGVMQGAYATGAALNRIGVIPGGDMTLEAAFAKLHVLAARGASPAEMKAQVSRSLSGELS